MPPSFNDEIHYECLTSVKDWSENRILARKTIYVDREQETLCKSDMLTEYYEEKGAINVYMKQRAFQRGKFTMMQMEGKVTGVYMALVQHKRIRSPGLDLEGCYFKERIICARESDKDKKLWPKEWSLEVRRC